MDVYVCYTELLVGRFLFTEFERDCAFISHSYLCGTSIRLYGFQAHVPTCRSSCRIVQKLREPTGADEFAFLNETVTSISKANEQMKTALHEHRLSMRDKFLRDLLYGLVPPDKVDDLLNTHQLQSLSTALSVCVVSFSNDKELEEQYSKDAILR